MKVCSTLFSVFNAAKVIGISKVVRMMSDFFVRLRSKRMAIRFLFDFFAKRNKFARNISNGYKSENKRFI